MTRENRHNSAPVEIRSADGGARVLDGYAAVFNVETVICGCFREKFAPGAFKQSVASGDVRALFNHDTSIVLGRTKPGTLRLKEDDKGLNYQVDLPNTQPARDLEESVTRGDIDGSSFGFISLREEWDETGEMPLRTVLEAELIEVSPCTFPAYDDSTVAMRSLEGARKDRRAQNFTAAARRLSMKATVDLRARGLTSKASA